MKDDMDLERLLAKVKGRQMTEAELTAQKVSFAFGNAPSGDRSTIEAVRDAITKTRVTHTAR